MSLQGVRVHRPAGRPENTTVSNRSPATELPVRRALQPVSHWCTGEPVSNSCAHARQLRAPKLRKIHVQ